MILPSIHLNGTSADALQRGYMTAYEKLQEALVALTETAPNGRDYYPQGPQAIHQATKEHRARIHLVETVRAELEALILHCMDAQHPGGRDAQG